MAKKQAAGRGSIVKRKDGRWMAAATIGGQRVYFYGSSQGEAAEKLDKALQESRDGVYIKPTKQTFGDWLNIWLKEYSKPAIRPTTYDSYEYIIRVHINPALGLIPLKELQPSQIQKFYNTKNKTLSPSTVRHMHIVINQALDQALKEGKIIRNPAKATKPPKIEKKEARYLTPEQLAGFLESISDDRWYSAFIVDLNSGMRLGELCALKWSNVDLQKGTVTVKEAVSRINKNGKWIFHFHPPKSKKGLRTIPLPSGAVEELKRLKKRQNEEKLRLQITGLYQDNGFIFTWEDGRMVDPTYLSKHFLKLIRQHGLSVNFHGLRHSYASALLAAGEHPKVVQELLGDSTISVVLDTYSHVLPGLKERAASRLEGVFEKKKPSSANEG
jgi:integrase